MSQPSNEISALVQGLAAEIGRRQARGQRRNPASQRPQGIAPEPLAGLQAVRRAAAPCDDLQSLGQAVEACRACPLGQSRERSSFNSVPKTPAEGLEVVLLSGAPGPAEEASGRALAGEAAEMLEAILTKGMRREPSSVHVTAVVKCRPPGDREPTQGERAACAGFLERELELLRPKVVLALGARAAEHLLKVERVGSGARGRLHEVQGQRVIPTFHPAFLIQNPDRKGDCWKDIQLAMEQL